MVALHKAELLENWQRARDRQPLSRIAPLEQLKMHYHILEARYANGHRLWLRFADGTQGEIYLVHELTGPVFEALRDIDYFAKFELDPTFHTLVWPNGADFAPEFLRDQLRVTAYLN